MEGPLKCSLTGANGGVEVIIVERRCEGLPGQAWIPDKTGTAAIWVANPAAVPVEKKGLGDGYVWIKSRGITYFS